METKNKAIIACRLCKKKKLEKIFEFGLIPLGNNLQPNKQDSQVVERYPLCIVCCLNCRHFQLNYSVDPYLLYKKNYTYLSGIGKSFRDHLDKFASDIIKFYSELADNKKLSVVDIGSNDGTALSFLKHLDVKYKV